ncbi:thioesterase-like superfamily-domain-containing protein [Podospora australis]|uniref:Thioesterase-like superfamily-domain-containing protein n=1 Tax=Podospora australis TaxID=1536484 RepID=A0AAN7AEM1_9PEZI|nr:thioesterase-like superfamily-domain-containing protein [Podospora australis]
MSQELVSFSEAVKVQQLDSHTYKVNLHDSYCIGSVPNGGYTASCLLEAARLHLASRGQPDPMTAHFQFINRTEVGPAVIIISDVKPGRQLSVVHLTLYQRGLLYQAPWITKESTRIEIVAYLTMTNLSKERGLTLPTIWKMSPEPPAPSPKDFDLLKQDKDPYWAEFDLSSAQGPNDYRRCMNNCYFYFPRGRPQVDKSVIDLWMRFKCDKFTNSSLGFVADAWPYVVEAYRPAKGNKPFGANEVFWYPTVVMSLDLKRPLPESGVEWLRLRMQSKEIRNGRLDLEVLVTDQEGQLVAISNQVNLILGSERNTGARSHDKGKI